MHIRASKKGVLACCVFLIVSVLPSSAPAAPFPPWVMDMDDLSNSRAEPAVSWESVDHSALASPAKFPWNEPEAGKAVYSMAWRDQPEAATWARTQRHGDKGSHYSHAGAEPAAAALGLGCGLLALAFAMRVKTKSSS